jgi:hypothetical protein
MVKKILIILAFTLSLNAYAETHYKPHISVGAKAGVTMSKVSFSPSVKQGWQMGEMGGITVRYAEEKLVGIIAELNFEQRGWKEDYEEYPFSYSRTLNYIQLPIMTHITFGAPRSKFFFNLGPEFGYMIGSSISSNFDYNNVGSVENFPIYNRMTEQLTTEVTGKFDYGISAGFGFEFFVQPQHSVNLECRYYYGLGNIFPSSKRDTFGASRTMSLMVNLGYYFRLK